MSQIKKLICFVIIMSSFHCITISNFPLSLFQIALIITFLFSLTIIIKMKIKGRSLYFSMICIVSAVIANAISINPEWARSYLLLNIMMGVLIFLTAILFSRRDIDLLIKTLIRSQYITIFLSIYCVILFYVRGELPQKITLLPGMYIFLDSNSIRRAQAASQLRLMLPYSTPSMLSVVMAICVILLIFNKKIYTNKARIFLIIVFSIIMFLTGSRTGLVAIGTVLAFWKIWDMVKKGLTIKTFIMLSVLLIVGVFLSQTVYVRKLLLLRSIGGNLLEDRHFLVPLDGLVIWTSSIQNFVMGIGFGSSKFMTGRHTVLPEYFLNSFVTLVAERGILGVLIVGELFWLVFVSIKRFKLYASEEKGIILAFYMTMISFVFYELINCYFIIVFIAIVHMIVTKGSNMKKQE